MSRKTLLLAAVLAASLARAESTTMLADLASESKAFGGKLTVTADRIAADRNTEALIASGHVVAVSAPARIHADFLERDTNGVCRTGADTSVTTCTNCMHDLHWEFRGEMEYQAGDHIMMRNAVLYFFELPVFWLPYLYYPINGNYGYQMMVGYTGRWGAYIQNKYSYDIFGNAALGADGKWMTGATRFDLRYKNGLAVGEDLEWSFGEFGQGHFKVYYAWDLDAEDRYGSASFADGGVDYRNWGSSVPENRYGIEFAHRVDLNERDTLRLRGQVYSDTFFKADFLRRYTMGIRNDFGAYAGNEVAWEHLDKVLSFGVSASGPLNEFYGGTARLPEVYFDVAPTPIWNWPVNYESQSRIGYLRRSYATYGDSSVKTAFSCNPGEWAEYETLRFDTYHRFSAPLKFWDALSVVPRLAYHGTYWNRTGDTSVTGIGESGSNEDNVLRSIFEAGVTFAGRGTGWINEDLQHLVEPYFDVLAQEACYSGLDDGHRPYIFDSIDASSDWSDQFAGRSRNLPYSWYGVTPGLRNALRRTDESGLLRTMLDVDVYAAFQFNGTDFTVGGDSHRLAEPGKPNYDSLVVPGVRGRWFPIRDGALSGRIEYDGENNAIAQATLNWSHSVSKRFSYYATWISRDHRWWDFSSTPVTDGYFDGFNWAKFSRIEVGFEHELCDAFAWAPYLMWDCRTGELDEVGAWFDIYRTDCLGFRLNVAYENEYTRIDGTMEDPDWRIGFFIYLRAVGPNAAIGTGN